MKLQIVVSRYNENIEWTLQFINNVVIYNKGEPIDEKFKAIPLPNLGREGHTYYYHIYENYDNLADHTVFLQGHPFDHSPFILNQINSLIYNNNSYIKYKHLSLKVLKSNFHFEMKREGRCKNIYKNYEKWLGKTIPNNENREIEFAAGAQFVVSKDTILKRPREFYYNVMKSLDHSMGPTEGMDLERLHKVIFTEFD